MSENLDLIRQHLRDELIPDKRERGKYLCPICHSGVGEGSNHDGAFSIAPDGIHGKCFSCDFYGDIFDLEAAKTGLSLPEATRAVVARYEFAPHPSASAPAPAPVAAPVPAASFAGKLAAWHSALKGSEGEAYLRRRGITPETMDRFNLGYGTDRNGHGAIVFPYNRQGTYYSMRAASDDVPKDQRHTKPKTEEAGPEPIFNAEALYQKEPCFVVESQLCAISIGQEGGAAIACGGRGLNKIKALKDKPSALLILAMDNDEPGQAAQSELAEYLRENDIPFVEYNVAGDCKDPNELLQKNPAALRGGIAAAIEIANAVKAEEAEKEKADYEAQTAAASFSKFEDFLTENGERPPIPTGFNNLDRVLNGGLSAGLYIMGAISSLGKTSWMLNIADNIAAAGRDVLYFSLEMSRNELIAKSISRFSFRVVGEASGPEDDAFSTFEVLNSRGRRSLSMSQEITLDKAFQAYREGPGRRMWIFEGVGDFGVEEITQRVEEHIRITGRTPVVFVDYLQILAPADPRSTDKQNTDKAVVELKRLSAKHDLPVFCISSLNRQNYSEPITMAAFKESGAIEYGSDVLIGIQLYGIGYQPGEKPGNAHTARIREIIEKAEKDKRIDIEIRVLKNRNGGRGGSGRLLFNKKYNFFSEVPEGFTYSDTPDTPFDDDDDPI
jgi:replicative DNA helicase